MRRLGWRSALSAVAEQRSKRESTALAAQQSSNNARAAQGVPRMKISRAYFFHSQHLFSVSARWAMVGTRNPQHTNETRRV